MKKEYIPFIVVILLLAGLSILNKCNSNKVEEDNKILKQTYQDTLTKFKDKEGHNAGFGIGFKLL